MDRPGVTRSVPVEGMGQIVWLSNSTAPPVRQEPVALGREWWQRAEDGVLWVQCCWSEPKKTKSGLRYSRTWGLKPAPIPEWVDPPDLLHPHKKPVELPDRSPNVDRITCALDLRGLYGPEVDEALGVSTPLNEVVDAWEAGTLVPTHDEIRRLATLTGMLPSWFYEGTLPLMSNVFICPGAGDPGRDYFDDTPRSGGCGTEPML